MILDDLPTITAAPQKASSYVSFVARSIIQGFQSEQQGRPVYAKRDFIRIQHPGERDCVEREATDYDKQLYARQWVAYETSSEQVPDGTPLSVIFPSNPDIVDNLRAIKFFTAEQVANATDAQLQGAGIGGLQIRQKCKAFIESANRGVPVHQFEQEKRDMQSKIDQLTKQVEALLADKEKKKDAK